MKIAIFGGSFDPPHEGHKAIVESLEKLDFIDKIIILPAFNNPLKNKPFLSAQSRLELLREITQGARKSVISTFDLDKQKPSYMIESVRHFRALYNPSEIFVVIGADILSELDKWHEIDALKKEATFIIATRGGIKIPKEMLTIDIDCAISSSAIREKNGNFRDSRVESYLLKNKNEVKTLQNRLDAIRDLLDSKKAENIELFDLSETSYITRYVIIATSLADKHGMALLETLKSELKNEKFYATDEENGDWIIADLGDIMIHIFTENHRKKFNLEEFLKNYGKM